jgi:hypothetical protein
VVYILVKERKAMIKKLFIAAAALAGVAAAPAGAVIVSGTLTGGNYQALGGSFIVTTAALTPNIGVDAINLRNVYAINERGGVALTATTNRWTVAPLSAGVPLVALAVGTKVLSQFIFIDPPTIPNPGSASGTVTFGTKILGYRWKQADLVGTNALLGAPGVTYGRMAPLETTNDFINFSGSVLTYSFTSTAITADMIRVITAVPEPAAWAMLIGGFAMVGAAARRRKVVVAA